MGGFSGLAAVATTLPDNRGFSGLATTGSPGGTPARVAGRWTKGATLER